MRRLIALFAFALALTACGSSSSAKKSSGTNAPTTIAPGSVYFAPLPPNPMALARAAGLVPETAERLQYHVHAHLDIFVNGVAKLIPGGIGIQINDPAVHSGTVDGEPAYGGINPPCNNPCISPLHTHDVTGVLHTESATVKDNTLGQFFIEWAVPLSKTCVGTYCAPATPIKWYVNGKPFNGDPRTIDLSNLIEIAVVIGSPAPSTIPSQFPQQTA
jgi:hypothetical protein